MNTLHEINEKARAILRSALGPVDYARYQQQFSSGHGDYTADRQALPQQGIDELSHHVAALKSSGQLIRPPGAKVSDGEE